MIKKAPGIKAEEIEWTGVNEWLDAQEGSVSREDLAAYLANNGVTVEEVTKGSAAKAGRSSEIQRELLPLIEERDRAQEELDNLPMYDGWKTVSTLADEMGKEMNDPDVLKAFDAQPAMIKRKQKAHDLTDRIQELTEQINRLQIESQNRNLGNNPLDTKWSTWTLPGGENYTELLLTLPGKIDQIDAETRERSNLAAHELRLAREAGSAETINEMQREWEDASAPIRTAERETYRSSHWDEPNVLAHVRFKSAQALMANVSLLWRRYRAIGIRTEGSGGITIL